MGVRKEAFKISSKVDNLTLYAIEVRPEVSMAVRGAVVIVHGMVEHKERYLPFMEYLASIGYGSIVYDQRGHGESVRKPEDLGYLYDHGETALVEDVQLMVEEAKKRFPADPVHLFGHSMGSLIVRNYLAKYDDEIATLTVSGCVSNNPAAGAGKAIASLIGVFKGERHRSPFLTKMAFSSYNKAFGEVKSPNAWLNTDEKAVEAYDNDPLCGYMFTINGNKALMQMIKMCYDPTQYEKKHLDIPVLFLSGADDPCCAGEKGFNDAVDFLKGVGYTNVSGVMLPGMRHEILNEPEHQKVYDLVAAHLARA